MSAFAVAIGGKADICFCTANTGEDAGCRCDDGAGCRAIIRPQPRWLL